MKKVLFVILVILMASFVVQAQDGAELPVTESGPEVLIPDIVSQDVKISDKIVVLVSGHTGTFGYDGNEHTVDGYEYEIKCDENPDVDLSDFNFNLKEGFGTVVQRTDPTYGPAYMGVNRDYFDYNRDKFVNVEISVEDGWIEITENEEWNKVLYPELYALLEEPVEEPVVEWSKNRWKNPWSKNLWKSPWLKNRWKNPWLKSRWKNPWLKSRWKSP